MTDEHFMRLALAEAAKALAPGNAEPYGACIAREGAVIALASSSVYRDNDATCHAEVNAIRAASRTLGTFDLSGCVMYSTTEPCPMCFTAIHWAGIRRIAFGASIADSRAIGFDELPISNARMAQLGGTRIELLPGLLGEPCRALLRAWAEEVAQGRIRVPHGAGYLK